MARHWYGEARVPRRRLTAHLCGAVLAAASFVALAAQALAAEPGTGVTDTEILVGTITDVPWRPSPISTTCSAASTFTAADHHGATQAFLAVIHNGRWVPVLDHPLAY